MKPKQQDDSGITQKAAEWFFALPKADTNEHAAFGTWLRESPRHVEEFLLVTAAYREVDNASASASLESEGLRAQLQAGVVPLPGRLPQSATVPRRTRKDYSFRSLATAASVAACAVAVGWWLHFRFDVDEYSTEIGEIRSFELDDGSLVQLNTLSRVKIAFSGEARDVQLLSGEAVFRVARDSTRPFRVQTGSAMIQALGTEFNVHRRERETTVSVLEGAVRVSESADSQSPHVVPQTLAAGEEARIAWDGKVTRLKNSDTVKATAWRQRRLIFRGDHLADVAAEFNRFNRSPQIRVTGEAARSKPLAGIFDADDPESLLQFLAAIPDLKIVHKAEEVVVTDR